MAIDTHAHLEMKEFDQDRREVIGRARAAGVKAIITVGTTLEDCRKALALAEDYEDIWAAVGIHPHEVKGCGRRECEEIRDLARREKVVAVGEIGLDFHYEFSPRDEQQRFFAAQLDVAEELDLPVIVHDRQAHRETLAILEPYRGRLRGVLHCFSGDVKMAYRCLDMGFFLSVAGPVTYKNATVLREVAKAIPADRLLIETDCPYLAPLPHRGKRNEPAFVVETAAFLAGLRGVSREELEDQTERNARALFGMNGGQRPASRGDHP